MANEGIRNREEIAEQYKWRLEDIYEADGAWERDFTAMQAEIADLPKLQAGLTADKASILRTLKALDALDQKIERLYSYAHMRRDQDSRNTQYLAMNDRVMTLLVRANAGTAFLSPALLAMPEQLLKDCVSDPAFSDYDRTLEAVLRMRPHTLPAEQEELLAEAGEIGGVPSAIYDAFTEADLKFPQIEDEDGTPIEVTEGRMITLLQSRSPKVRKAAYEAIMNTYGSFGNMMAATYSGSVKNDVFDARAHKFTSAIEASLFSNEIPVSVYDALEAAIEEHLPALNRYLGMKKEALGLSELHMWDLYVDTSVDYELKLSYEEAYNLVMEATAPLGADYVAVLKEARDNRWIDVYENAGKANGAYSSGTANPHPYVLMNFEGTLDSASTLAHEMGHSMHSYYSGKTQPFAKSHYTLFAAEVASTVNEILLSMYMLDKHPERAAQQSILGTLLEHFRTTVFRQTLFATFERETHAMQERGESLTKEAMCDLYYGINKKYYGEACIVDDAVRNEWMRIPHFYRAFYVYQYATGFSAAVSIARKIIREGQPAVDGYKQFLSAGGSLPPIDALRLAGVDMATPQPVREALEWFEEVLDRFDKVR